ncbi:hypothetical protein J520_2231 [Acinetobacter sp. 869535]|nr:hypothetical protein J520_2231 [Acinetobacter sp. 869535]
MITPVIGVHCHIGSLEKYHQSAPVTHDVHCHIGSLENV